MPPLFMPTGPAYQKLDERKELSIDKTEDCLKALEERDWEGLADSLSNDFELGLFPNSPGLLSAARYVQSFDCPAVMTGSGSAFYLIPGSHEEGQWIVEQIHEENQTGSPRQQKPSEDMNCKNRNLPLGPGNLDSKGRFLMLSIFRCLRIW